LSEEKAEWLIDWVLTPAKAEQAKTTGGK